MKLYKYCSKTLTYQATSLKLGILSILITILSFGIGFGVRHFNDTKYVEKIEQEEMVVIVNKNLNESFKPYMLYDYLIEMNVEYPDLVFAQAVLESGNFKSGIFRANNNCFGMKISSKRPSTARGLENDHAYYNNWKESAQDYAFYQASYLRNLDRNEYRAFIEANYSGTPGYINRVDEIIKNLDKHLKREDITESGQTASL